MYKAYSKIIQIYSSGWDLAQWLKSLTANAEIAIILGSIPESSDTVKFEWLQMK